MRPSSPLLRVRKPRRDSHISVRLRVQSSRSRTRLLLQLSLYSVQLLQMHCFQLVVLFAAYSALASSSFASSTSRRQRGLITKTASKTAAATTTRRKFFSLSTSLNDCNPAYSVYASVPESLPLFTSATIDCQAIPASTTSTTSKNARNRSRLIAIICSLIYAGDWITGKIVLERCGAELVVFLSHAIGAFAFIPVMLCMRKWPSRDTMLASACHGIELVSCALFVLYLCFICVYAFSCFLCFSLF